MFNSQLIQWSLWGLSLLAGVGAILALFKLRYAERFLPQWNQLKEELRQATEGIDKCRAEIGQLEATVGHLRILKEWQNANPEAAARIQQMMTDLERCKSELAAVQQKLAQDEQRLNEVTQETNLFRRPARSATNSQNFTSKRLNLKRPCVTSTTSGESQKSNSPP